MTLWDKNHGIKNNELVRIKVRNGEIAGMVNVFEGTATEVAEHEVYLSGDDMFDIDRNDQD